MTACPTMPSDKVCSHEEFRFAMRNRQWIGLLPSNTKIAIKFVESVVYGNEHDAFLGQLVADGTSATDSLSLEEFEPFSKAFMDAKAEDKDGDVDATGLGLCPALVGQLEPSEVEAMKSLSADDKNVMQKAETKARQLVSEHVHLIDVSLARPLVATALNQSVLNNIDSVAIWVDVKMGPTEELDCAPSCLDAADVQAKASIALEAGEFSCCFSSCPHVLKFRPDQLNYCPARLSCKFVLACSFVATKTPSSRTTSSCAWMDAGAPTLSQ